MLCVNTRQKKKKKKKKKKEKEKRKKKKKSTIKLREINDSTDSIPDKTPKRQGIKNFFLKRDSKLRFCNVNLQTLPGISAAGHPL